MAALASQRAAFRAFQGLGLEQPLSASCSVAQELGSQSILAPRRTPGTAVVAEKKVVKKKQIILTKNVPNLGSHGDLLSVRLGFFRNYLFPQGLAKTATPQILKAIEAERAREEKERQQILDDARKLARQFQTIGGFAVRRKAGVGKSFFGSVTKLDLVDIIRANTGKEIDKNDIELPEIKEVGEYIAKVKLHPEVTAEVRVNVIGK